MYNTESRHYFQEKLFTFFIATFLLLIHPLNIFCQDEDDDDPYGEQYYGQLMTDRNYGGWYSDLQVLEPCRKIIHTPLIFGESGTVKDISIVLKKKFEDLTDIEKEQIMTNAFFTEQPEAFEKVMLIIRRDTAKEQFDMRIHGLMCLSKCKTKEAKDFLLSNLKSINTNFAMFSALSLVQIGEKKESYAFIKNNFRDYRCKDYISTALIIINTPEATQLLMKISEDHDPSYAIDALAALSLLGYCDYSFNGFLKYCNNPIPFVRQMAAWCLAYYTGTPEAFEAIKKIPPDDSGFVNDCLNKIYKLFNYKN